MSLQLQVNTENSALEIPVAAVVHCSAAGEQLPTTTICLSYFGNPQTAHCNSSLCVFCDSEDLQTQTDSLHFFFYISRMHAAASLSRREAGVCTLIRQTRSGSSVLRSLQQPLQGFSEDYFVSNFNKLKGFEMIS